MYVIITYKNIELNATASNWKYKNSAMQHLHGQWKGLGQVSNVAFNPCPTRNKHLCLCQSSPVFAHTLLLFQCSSPSILKWLIAQAISPGVTCLIHIHYQKIDWASIVGTRWRVENKAAIYHIYQGAATHYCVSEHHPVKQKCPIEMHNVNDQVHLTNTPKITLSGTDLFCHYELAMFAQMQQHKSLWKQNVMWGTELCQSNLHSVWLGNMTLTHCVECGEILSQPYWEGGHLGY